MATRSNILVKYGKTQTYLYRHWDGYPSVNGAALVKIMEGNVSSPTEFLRSLLAGLNDFNECDYEITSDWHGDIQWAYVIEFSSVWNERKNGPRFGAKEIGFGPDRESELASLHLLKAAMTLEEFALFCKKVHQ